MTNKGYSPLSLLFSLIIWNTLAKQLYKLTFTNPIVAFKDYKN